MGSPSGSNVASLGRLLASVLPQGAHFSIKYIHSKPKKCEPLFSPLPNSQSESTTSISHFLTVSIDRDGRDVFVFAVEVLVYSTARLTTFFVSKADSTGYLGRSGSSIIRPVTSTFLRWLSDRELTRRPTRKQVISLFGRAQGQYLFPGSAQNPGKHVLDDRQLIKWWARTLQPLFISHGSDTKRKGYVTVPGYRGVELRRFYPQPQSTDWQEGHPLHEIAAMRGVPEHAPTRCLLPRFPDDPKARYMQDLDDEVGLAEDAGAAAVTASPTKRKNARWKVVHTLEMFWEGMEFRQECSSGRVVGFLWLVIDPAGAESQPESQLSQVHQASQISEAAPANRRKVAPPKKHRLRGHISTRPARTKGSSRTGQRAVNNFDGDGLCLTADGYDQAMQTLLHLDFATLDVAVKSTSKWIMELSSTAGLPRHSWTLKIEGTSAVTTVVVHQNGTQVNDLGGMIRKKKRPAETDSTIVPAVNTLSAGLIRKKPKT